MHELSIAQNIVSAVREDYEQRGETKPVTAVRVRVGDLSGVEPDALAFSYEVSCEETPLKGSRLEIERVATRARCDSCGREFGVSDYVFLCPACSGGKTTIVRGREMQIVNYEVG